MTSKSPKTSVTHKTSSPRRSPKTSAFKAAVAGVVCGCLAMLLITVCACYSGCRLFQQKAKEKYGINIDMPAAYMQNVSTGMHPRSI